MVQCINCNKNVNENEIFPEDAVELINKYNGGNSKGYCVKCAKNKYLESFDLLIREKSSWELYFKKQLNNIPTITLQSPFNWDYECLNVVSGQISIGMGIVGGLSSTFANLMGSQSSEYNQKIITSEITCLNLLRLRTLQVGGNAVIGIDLNYSTTGGSNDLLMVTAVGTAIKLKNLEILGDERKRLLQEVTKKMEEFVPLLKYKFYKV